MKCPHCAINLVMSEKQGIEIDYCPECRGIWLDKGELEKIIERSAQSNSSSYQNQSYNNNEHHEKQYKHAENEHHFNSHGEKKHKKRSFLEDIFDFG